MNADQQYQRDQEMAARLDKDLADGYPESLLKFALLMRAYVAQGAGALAPIEQMLSLQPVQRVAIPEASEGSQFINLFNEVRYLMRRVEQVKQALSLQIAQSAAFRQGIHDELRKKCLGE